MIEQIYPAFAIVLSEAYALFFALYPTHTPMIDVISEIKAPNPVRRKTIETMPKASEAIAAPLPGLGSFDTTYPELDTLGGGEHF